MSVKVVSDHSRAIARAFKTLELSKVYVGIPGSNAARDDGMNNVALGYIHETGEPSINLPARPWLVPGLATVEDKIAKRLLDGALQVVQGDARAADRALNVVGLMAVNAIQARITSGIAPPLSERTIYARMHRKRNRRKGTSGTPLIDTGSFYRSITYVIRRGA